MSNIYQDNMISVSCPDGFIPIVMPIEMGVIHSIQLKNVAKSETLIFIEIKDAKMAIGFRRSYSCQSYQDESIGIHSGWREFKGKSGPFFRECWKKTTRYRPREFNCFYMKTN